MWSSPTAQVGRRHGESHGHASPCHFLTPKALRLHLCSAGAACPTARRRVAPVGLGACDTITGLQGPPSWVLLAALALSPRLLPPMSPVLCPCSELLVSFSKQPGGGRSVSGREGKSHPARGGGKPSGKCFPSTSPWSEWGTGIGMSEKQSGTQSQE